MEHIDWYVVFILVGLLVSIPHFFLLKQYKKQHLITFIILLLATALESYGSYTVSRKINNVLSYNLFFVYVETLLILIFLSSLISSDKVKSVIKAYIIIFISFGLIYTIFIENLLTFHNYSFSLGSAFIITTCIYFFISILNKEMNSKSKLVLNPIFWIVTLILLFYTSTFFYFSSLKLLLEIERDLVKILSSLNRVVAISMYLVMGGSFYLSYFHKKII